MGDGCNSQQLSFIYALLCIHHFHMQKTLPFGRAYCVVCHEKRVVCRSGNDFDGWFVKVMVEVMKRVCKELVLCNISD